MLNTKSQCPHVSAGVQYTGHSSPITALCWLPTSHPSSGSLVATCDASGALHIWSAATGAGKLIFRESATGTSSAAERGRRLAGLPGAAESGQRSVTPGIERAALLHQ